MENMILILQLNDIYGINGFAMVDLGLIKFAMACKELTHKELKRWKRLGTKMQVLSMSCSAQRQRQYMTGALELNAF